MTGALASDKLPSTATMAEVLQLADVNFRCEWECCFLGRCELKAWETTLSPYKMSKGLRILVPVKRVIDYAVSLCASTPYRLMLVQVISPEMLNFSRLMGSFDRLCSLRNGMKTCSHIILNPGQASGKFHQLRCRDPRRENVVKSLRRAQHRRSRPSP